MSERLIGPLSTLHGVLLDRIAAWQKALRIDASPLDHARLKRRLEADRINRAIDEDIADESSLDALINHLERAYRVPEDTLIFKTNRSVPCKRSPSTSRSRPAASTDCQRRGAGRTGSVFTGYCRTQRQDTSALRSRAFRSTLNLLRQIVTSGVGQCQNLITRAFGHFLERPQHDRACT